MTRFSGLVAQSSRRSISATKACVSTSDRSTAMVRERGFAESEKTGKGEKKARRLKTE